MPAGGEQVVRLRLREASRAPVPAVRRRRSTGVFDERIAEADEFYAERAPAAATADERRVLRQGYAGLLWSKQFYHYVQAHWLEGDPSQPAPPAERAATAATPTGRTSTTATSSRCRTSGSTPGSPPGTWPFT